MAAAERQQPRLKQTPKHLERMLFVNHKEEQNLQRRLEAISTDGRAKGREIDMERIKVRNVWRYNSRLTHTHIAPLLDQIPALIKKETQRPNDPIDPVNVYLLREYRRNSQVIPSILSAVNKDNSQETEPNPESEVSHRDGKGSADKDRKTKAKKRDDGYRSIMRRSFNRKRQKSGEDMLDGEAIDYLNALYEDQPDTTKATQLVKDITKLRADMSANRRVEIKKPKVSFQNMLRSVREQEKLEGDSDTYTDGTCSLLRRKMHKLRNSDDIDSPLEVTLDAGKGEFKVKQSLPKLQQKWHSVSQTVLQTKKSVLPVTRSFSSVPTISRQQALLGESEDTMKKQLEEQERYNTEVKVAREIEKFQQIQRKISEFMEKHKRKVTYSFLFDNL